MRTSDDMLAPGTLPGARSTEFDNEVLVLGVGNVMLGDEGLGVHIARHLLDTYIFPPGIEIIDGGTGGLALLPFIRSARRVIVVDAIETGAEPGSIFMFDAGEIEEIEKTRISLHDMGIMDVLNTAGILGDQPEATIIGVQPEKMDDFGAGMSEAVCASMTRVVELVLEQLRLEGLSPRPKGFCSRTQQKS